MLGIVTLKQNIFAKNEDVLSADKEGITLKGDLEDGKSLSVDIYDSMSPEYQAANTYISAKEGIKAMNLYDISVLDSSGKEVKLSNKALLEFNENVCMPNVEGATYALYYESADGIYAKLDSYQTEGTICSESIRQINDKEKVSTFSSYGKRKLYKIRIPDDLNKFEMRLFIENPSNVLIINNSELNFHKRLSVKDLRNFFYFIK